MSSPCFTSLILYQYEYLWADGVKVKKPVRLSAPEYINKLYDWIEEQVRRGQAPASVLSFGQPARIQDTVSR